MRSLFRVLALVICLLIIGGSIAMAEEYRLGPGDVLNISLWGYEEVTSKTQIASAAGVVNGYLINYDGKLSFPLVGEITAAGLTTSQFTAALTQALKEYINDPKVIVNIVKFRTTRVYVLGEVNRPGMYELEKLHNVLDAVGIAGGYTKYAAKKSVFLLRGGRPEQPIKINLLKLLKEGDMSQNYQLFDGDVVFLSDSGKLDFTRDVLPLLTGGYYMTHFNDK